MPDEYGGLFGDERMNLVASPATLTNIAGQARLPLPDRLRVAQADRTLRDVDAATEETRLRLKRDTPELTLYMVGNTVQDGSS